MPPPAPKSPARLNELTATEVVAAIKAGRATCEDVTRACLERIEARDRDVQAWQYIDPDQAIAEARARDRGDKSGPLTGVPFNVKDIIDTGDMPTEYGSPIYKDFRPRADASCVAMSRKAGAVLLGKAVTTEFANFHPSRTKNPLDLTRTPGGSSAGSAASVADFMCALSVGSQTSGSTVRPAGYCGVIGFRPTYGELRCAGMMESAGSLDTVGLIARSVDDIALYRDVLLGEAPVPVKDLPPPRIGFCRTHLWPLLEPTTQQLFEDAAKALAKKGATVTDVTLPREFDGIPEAHRLISGFEFARNFTWEVENHWEEISATLRAGRIDDGLNCSYETYLQQRALAESCRATMTRIQADYDILLTACATGEAPVGFATTGIAKLALIWTTMHVPAMSVPVLKGPAGMPIPVYVAGKRSQDRELFAHARWVQRALS